MVESLLVWILGPNVALVLLTGLIAFFGIGGIFAVFYRADNGRWPWKKQF